MPGYQRAYLEYVSRPGRELDLFDCYATLEPESWPEPMQFYWLTYVLGGIDAQEAVVTPETLSPAAARAYRLDAEGHGTPPAVTFLRWSDAAAEREAQIVETGTRVSIEMRAAIGVLRALGPSARMVVWCSG